MPFRDLREYVEAMRKSNRMIVVDDEVDVDLEIAELTRRATYAGLPPLLFNKVKGFQGWRVLTNVFYSVEAIRDMLGAERLEDLTRSFLAYLSVTPSSMVDKLRSMSSMLRLGRIFPRTRKQAFSESSLDFSLIPALRTWPKDAGRFMTFSILITKDPESRVHNLSVYRIQILNRNEALVHWQAFKRGSLTARKYLDRGITKVPAVIVNGVDPVLAFTAASPVPPGLDKYLFYGILRGEGAEVTELDNGIRVPSYAETVFEGEVDLSDLRIEGPFGDHMGYYTPPDYYPVFKLRRSYSRDNPIFHATSVGKPPLEDAWIGKAVERLFLPFFRLVVPEIVDMNLPEYGLFTGVGIFSIRKTFPGQGKRAMLAIWGTGQLSLLKVIIVVDHDVNVHDLNQVIYAISTTVDPKRDVLVIDNALTDSLDPATPTPPLGSKLGIDATRKFKEELGKDWPEEEKEDPQVSKRIDPIWAKILKARGLP
jgi:4-hydroxy-3-polyprenylbenzoate decarboxylase